MLKDFVALIYPLNCLSCSEPLVKNESHVCTKCLFELPETYFHLDINESGVQQENVIHGKFLGKVPVKYALSYFHYKKTTKVQHLLHQIKYHEGKETGFYLGKRYGYELNEAVNTTLLLDGIIPVPLHPNKMKKRGFNQAERIASGLSESLGVSVLEGYLKRNLYTETQTRKSRVERWKNVKNVFSIGDIIQQKPDQVKNKHFLIVDDVITTGSTIEACAKPLLDAGASSVSVFALAVAE